MKPDICKMNCDTCRRPMCTGAKTLVGKDRFVRNVKKRIKKLANDGDTFGTMLCNHASTFGELTK